MLHRSAVRERSCERGDGWGARARRPAVPARRAAEQLDHELAARMCRQRRLRSAANPLELVTVVDESALHRPVGGPDVLRTQLEQIVVLAGLDTVTLRVLPSD